MWFALIMVVSYLLGSIPTAVWMGKAVRGVDVRDYGSGNAGATNALRVLGLKWGLLVMAIDMGKGLLAVLVLAPLVPSTALLGASLVPVLVGGAAILGHIFPVTIGFRGGKGVGTGAGVLFALAPVVTLCAVIIWVLIVTATRYVSLGSIVAAILFAPMLLLSGWVAGNEPGWPLLIFSVALAIAVLISHRSNINRLLSGTENKLSLGASRSKGISP
jgi:glycerol-3-phosphate acyltransferase PlsY